MNPASARRADRPPRPPVMVVFDCDGVLVDTERPATAIEARILTEMGCPPPQAEVVATFMGRSGADSFAVLTGLLGPELALQFEERASVETRAAFIRELSPVPGVVAVLDALEGAGIPFCVAFSGSHARMEPTWGSTGLAERLTGHIHSADDVDRGKPWPDVFVLAARCEETAPEHCLVIEDSVNGVRAARAAGMDVLGFSGGLTSAGDLREAGATPFQAMADLPPLLGLHTPPMASGRASAAR